MGFLEEQHNYAGDLKSRVSSLERQDDLTKLDLERMAKDIIELKKQVKELKKQFYLVSDLLY